MTNGPARCRGGDLPDGHAPDETGDDLGLSRLNPKHEPSTKTGQLQSP